MPTHRPPARADTGDLRQRILDTSRTLLAEQGVAGLSLREVARRAGVTHQAPYHHFADRESILAELVTLGFDDLAGRLAKANAMAATHAPLEMLVASGLAYVGFALDEPGVFRVMFRPDLCDMARFEAAQAAGGRAHAELQQLVRLAHGELDDTVAAVVWAQVHGLATLMLDGPLSPQLSSRRAQQTFVRSALTLFARQMLAAAVPNPGAKPAPASPTTTRVRKAPR